MTEKSDLWDIKATAEVTFRRVYFGEEITKEEAISRFILNLGDIEYQEIDTDQENVKEVLSAEAY